MTRREVVTDHHQSWRQWKRLRWDDERDQGKTGARWRWQKHRLWGLWRERCRTRGIPHRAGELRLQVGKCRTHGYAIDNRRRWVHPTTGHPEECWNAPAGRPATVRCAEQKGRSLWRKLSTRRVIDVLALMRLCLLSSGSSAIGLKVTLLKVNSYIHGSSWMFFFVKFIYLK